MAHQILRLIVLGGGCVVGTSSTAQFSTNPVQTVYQTQLPVFENGPGESPPLANFRMHLDYRLPHGRMAELSIGDRFSLNLPPAEDPSSLELVYEHTGSQPARLSAFLDGHDLLESHEPPGATSGERVAAVPPEAGKRIQWAEDFTLAVQFHTIGSGTLASICPAEEPWAPDAKALYIREDGRLVYDIGWVGSLTGEGVVNDGTSHWVTLVVERGRASLYIDNRMAGRRDNFSAPDVNGHVFKIGQATPDFGFDFEGGEIEEVRYWEYALPTGESAGFEASDEQDESPPMFTWGGVQPAVTFPSGVPGWPVTVVLRGDVGLRIDRAWVQPLGVAHHADLISGWSEETLRTGERIYRTLCVTCHGTAEKMGSLPSALQFHAGTFRNGSDPFRMFSTLSDGFGMMVPQPQYTVEEKYAVIHYIRETLVRPHNPGQLFPLDQDYLQALPVGMHQADEAPPDARKSRDVYENMDFGPYLMWTYQVDRGAPAAKANLAYKGIAVRLDSGPGGVSKGRAWMVYDHDTLRVAAACAGKSFVDWKGIAFDGSHGTHTSLASELTFANPVGPGWAHPVSGQWDDPRLRGRDGKRYGPLPREWAHYQGVYLHGDRVVLRYTVGEAEILESPGWIDYGAIPVFIRTLAIVSVPHPLQLRVAPVGGMTVKVIGTEAGRLAEEDGFFVLHIPSSPSPVRCSVFMARTTDSASIEALAAGHADLPDVLAWTHGGPRRWPEILTTQVDVGAPAGAFAVDNFTLPDHTMNPWSSWMRLGGFDFFADGERAAVCTWNGDVWIVDGVGKSGEHLSWQRIATGLFQPLGLKIVDDVIHVACRDQIARLHDLNGDEEIDFVENFNNDHQVTEHFHEFAMGLQQDETGHFYYAKSARHALPALVPHHGTLLRVAPDGSKTDIVATGFRAANGVCLNPDGTWMVTDQEGHWTPENRINLVREGGFYGNMMGFHDRTDASDLAMEQPLCWISNQMDRSPAEMCWVPPNSAWGPFCGTLLNTSYGQGKLYVVPHEVINGQAQGGVCQLPLPPFATGVMRARFHPTDGQLYGVGLFGWAGNQQAPGGFYRIRYTGRPAYLPVGLRATTSGMVIAFSDPLEPTSAENAENYRARIWSLRRNQGYGSDNYDERALEVSSAELSADRRTLRLEIPYLRPTWCMEIVCSLHGLGGEPVERIIHHTIHELGEP